MVIKDERDEYYAKKYARVIQRMSILTPSPLNTSQTPLLTNQLQKSPHKTTTYLNSIWFIS